MSLGFLFSGGIFSLTLGYALSQFYRAFLAVLAPLLGEQIGATPADLAVSSGLWFVVFAALQLPVGWAFDRFGPRLTVSVLLAAGGGGGAVVFAIAQAPWHLHVAMSLLGVGCAPVMLGCLFIFARTLPAVFMSAAAGTVVGIASLGNMLSAAPLVWVINLIGWREALVLLALITLAIALLIWLRVKDPAPQDGPVHRASLRELFGLRELRLILPLLGVSYAVSACIRGLWAGPFLSEVYGASDYLIGWVALGMGIAMVVGNLSVGWWVRILGSDKRASVAFNALLCTVVLLLWVSSGHSLALSAVLLVLVCVSDGNYSLLMGHGRRFMPPHLLGRGISLLNMTSVAGVGIMQFLSRPVYLHARAGHDAAHAYGYIFMFFLIPLVVGLVIYLLSPRELHA